MALIQSTSRVNNEDTQSDELEVKYHDIFGINMNRVVDHAVARSRSIHMDSMNVGVTSRHGDCGCEPEWDDCTGT